MVEVLIEKGLDLALEGAPSGGIKELKPSKILALDLSAFEEKRLHLLFKEGDYVQKGQAIVCDKTFEKRSWASPAAGTIVGIIRGQKRRILSILIERSEREESWSFSPASSSSEEIMDSLLQSGLFNYIRQRPFDMLADPQKIPECIFVKALESAPFVPSSELQLEGDLDSFEQGLSILSKIAKVHLVVRSGSFLKDFKRGALDIERHSFAGPHPVANPSVHIEHIHPIKNRKNIIWTINAYDVLRIGYFFKTKTLLCERVIGLGGAGVLPEARAFYKVRDGQSIEEILQNRSVKDKNLCYISGDVLSGRRSSLNAYLGYYDFVLSVLQEEKEREIFSFARLGLKKITASRTYISSFFPKMQGFLKNNLKHGEERAFIDSQIYQRVMPLPIRVHALLKAIIMKDFEKAEQLGLLEVAREDFALPSYVCPSKIEMLKIVERALKECEHA